METSSTTFHTNVREETKAFIPKIGSAKEIYKLFQLLRYPEDKLFDPSYKREIEEFDFKKDEREKIKAIYTVFSYEKDLPVFLMETTTTSHSFLKYVAKVLADRYLRFLLIVTTDYEEIVFVLPDYERVEAGKHKLRISKLVLDKDDLYYTDLETIVNITFQDEKSWRDLWKKWREAFDVEKVTERFFVDYQEVFFKVRSAVVKQKIATKDAHEFTLQLLNRIMFIYFVSKKRWLNNDPKFMRWLWKRYLLERSKENTAEHSFYSAWLTVVFFEGFNNKFRNNKTLPDDVKKVLREAPYLNGGLFRKGDLDNLSVRISDELFKGIFEFFERYNFTIKEDLLDAEVAVDPQMIGYVYESLANVAESSYEREEDLRGSWGIFYTPRIEVEFMCKRSLVEYLANHLAQVPKEKLYEFVFDEDKEKAEVFFEKEDFWYDLEDLLDNLSVVDPACGSGAFLVGMVNVLSELYRVIYRHMKRDLTDFELKNKIIMRSLYGVDVMPWAVHAAELRLWLQLIVESDLRPDDLKAHPLLPNLNMNLRIGDSLVQEIGGVSLHLHDPAIGTKMKQHLSEFKTEKERYFNNDPTAKFKNKEDLEKEQVRIFNEFMKERLAVLREEEDKLSKKLVGLEKGVQRDLQGNTIKPTPEEVDPIRERLESVRTEITDLEKALDGLRDPEKRPFVWEIDFAEIFGEKGGFDIVVGNPPYIEQTRIAPPTLPKFEVNEKTKKAYKEKLVQSVSAKFPSLQALDMRSDYFVYFFFHGLALLNGKGILCFITSNAWLDVGYGAELQKFLLTRTHIVGIYDNPKRAFAHAGINTVITLLGSPARDRPIFPSQGQNGEVPRLSHCAKFVSFNSPYEQVADSRTFNVIEKIGAKKRTGDLSELIDNIVSEKSFRAFPVIQEDLLAEGSLQVKPAGAVRETAYQGSKWGSKFLRAPDIFFTILRKGRDLLIRTDKIVTVEAGCYSGINEFFYLHKEKARQLGIERRFLVPLVKSPRQIPSLTIDPNNIDTVAFLCHLDKQALRKTGAKKALEYIEWGEKQVTKAKRKVKAGIRWPDVPTVKNRKPGWWAIPEIQPTHLFYLYGVNDRFGQRMSREPMISDRRFHMVYPKDEHFDVDLLSSILNSTVTYLFIELFGRVNLGEGALDFATQDANVLPIVNPLRLKSSAEKLRKAFDALVRRPVQSIFEECGLDQARPLRQQEPHPLSDRKQLDEVIFDVLELTMEERKEVYWSICELVKARLDKAKSLAKKETTFK